MKEYIDEKFWRMFAGFVTLLAISAVLLIFVRLYKDKNSTVDGMVSSVINYHR